MSAVHALTAAVGDFPSQLLPARSQMAFTLGVHVILVPLGVVFPLLMLLANYLGLRRDDADYMRLAERWSKVAAVTFAVGAVTGTVLSFEMGTWPGMFDRFGDVIGLAFALEGIFFFLEAIFISIYIFGWKRQSPWAHFWSGVPIPLCGLGGAFMVLSANAWMNQPGGFTIDAAGEVTSVDVWSAIFNDAVGYEFAHMYVADVHLRRVPGGVGLRGRNASRTARSLPPPRDSCCRSPSRPSRCRSRCSWGTSSRARSTTISRSSSPRSSSTPRRDPTSPRSSWDT